MESDKRPHKFEYMAQARRWSRLASLKRPPVIALIFPYGAENRGIRQLAAVLRKEGFRAPIILFKEWINNNIKPPTSKEILLLIQILKETKSDSVGIGFISSYLKFVRELTKKIHEELDLPVIWGGIHVTADPEGSMDYPEAICLGEGEIPLRELAYQIRDGGDIYSINNFWIHSENGILQNPLGPLVEDLDSLPFPDFSDNDKYFIENNKLERFDPVKLGAEYRIIASRGCPFSCSYCYNSILRRIYKDKGLYCRIRSVENVIDELKLIKTAMPRIRRIKMDDDTFLFNSEWSNLFCKAYPEIGLPFDCFLHPDFANEELLLKLKHTGLQRIEMGLQSGSESELKQVYHRAGKPGSILKFAEFNKKGTRFEVFYDVLIDNPLTTSEEKRELFDLLLKIPRPYKLYLLSLTHFPKTELTEDLLRKGIISNADLEGDNSKSYVQYRVSLFYPRPAEDIFWLSLIILASKSFVPRGLLKEISDNQWLVKNPKPLQLAAFAGNLIQMLMVAVTMFFRSELTFFKLRQYFSFKKMLTQ